MTRPPMSRGTAVARSLGSRRAAVPLIAAALAVQLGAASVVVLTRSLPEPAAPAVVEPPLTAALGGLRPDLRPDLRPGKQPAATPGLRTGAVRQVAPRVRVPSLDVDAPVIGLRRGADGELQVPRTAGDVGRWSAGPVPGDPGAAVLVGHVDLDGRQGVFAKLRDVRPGASITVLRPDGTEVVFVVDRVERYRKTAFPTDAVYEPTEGPTLRLVTCGGAFDRRTGHYLDNVVVYASPA